MAALMMQAWWGQEYVLNADATKRVGRGTLT